MIRLIAALALGLTVAACGVDGAPIPPSQVEEEPRSGVTISGSAEVGIRRRF